MNKVKVFHPIKAAHRKAKRQDALLFLGNFIRGEENLFGYKNGIAGYLVLFACLLFVSLNQYNFRTKTIENVITLF